MTKENKVSELEERIGVLEEIIFRYRQSKTEDQEQS